MTTTDTRTTCRVVDTITTWTDRDGNLNIYEGDLVLRDGRLELVEAIHFTLATHIMVRVELASHNAAVFAQPADLVAVRRYLVMGT